MMTARARIIGYLAIGLFLGCGPAAVAEQTNSSGPASEESDGLTVHQIIPSDTDPNINTFSGNGFQHWSWYNPAAKNKKPQLVVFLPGTGGKGKGSTPFNKSAAKWGYHVLSLAYPDAVSVSWFKRSDDREVYAKVRRNIITGRLPEGLKINEANSIEHRLVFALRYLAKTYPSEHWDEFLDADRNVTWDKTVLVGQSQGGGHACFMAVELHKVAKVLMFGAPKDYSRHFNKPAAWFSDKSVTPLDRFFCFVHSDDQHNGCTYPQQLQIYQALGLSPKFVVVNVDGYPPPFDHTRLLTSQVQQGNAHNAPLHDPRYRQVWKYMLFEAVQ